MDACIERFVEQAQSEAELVDSVSGHRRTGTLANFRYLIRGQADRLVEGLSVSDQVAAGLTPEYPVALTLKDQARQLACLCLGLAHYLNGSRPCPLCGGFGHQGGRPCEACHGTGVEGEGTS